MLLSVLGLLAYASITGKRLDFRGAPWRWILLGAVNAGIRTSLEPGS